MTCTVEFARPPPRSGTETVHSGGQERTGELSDSVRASPVTTGGDGEEIQDLLPEREGGSAGGGGRAYQGELGPFRMHVPDFSSLRVLCRGDTPLRVPQTRSRMRAAGSS